MFPVDRGHPCSSKCKYSRNTDNRWRKAGGDSKTGDEGEDGVRKASLQIQGWWMEYFHPVLAQEVEQRGGIKPKWEGMGKQGLY